MKNQWLARRSIEIDWNDIGLTDSYEEKMEALYVLMIKRRNAIGGGVIWMGPRIYDMFFNRILLLRHSFITKGAAEMGDTIRIAFGINNVRMHTDISVLNFFLPEEACDS